MNWDQVEGNWKQMKGKMKEKWGKLTDSDWDNIAGKRDQLIGKLQERYGYSKEQAERDLEDWDRAQSSSLESSVTGAVSFRTIPNRVLI